MRTEFQKGVVLFPELPKRRREVALMMIKGYTREQAAEMLGMKRTSYDTHRGLLHRQLNVRNVVELVLLAVRRGYIVL